MRSLDDNRSNFKPNPTGYTHQCGTKWRLVAVCKNIFLNAMRDLSTTLITRRGKSSHLCRCVPAWMDIWSLQIYTCQSVTSAPSQAGRCKRGERPCHGVGAGHRFSPLPPPPPPPSPLCRSSRIHLTLCCVFPCEGPGGQICCSQETWRFLSPAHLVTGCRCPVPGCKSAVYHSPLCDAPSLAWFNRVGHAYYVPVWHSVYWCLICRIGFLLLACFCCSGCLRSGVLGFFILLRVTPVRHITQ